MTHPAIKLNKVDAYIKSSMLNYPTLFKSRLSVLVQLFLTNGNGMEWVDGALVSRFGEERTRTEMDFSDLTERNAENEAEIAKLEGEEHGEYMLPLFLKRRAQLKREIADRQAIADDIDLYAVEHVMDEDDKHDAGWLKHIDPNWTMLALNNNYHEFPEVMDPDWAAAAEEIVKVAVQSLWRELGMYSEHYKEENADPVLLKKYRGFVEIENALDKFTGTKARTAENAARVSEMLKELMAEKE